MNILDELVRIAEELEDVEDMTAKRGGWTIEVTTLTCREPKERVVSIKRVEELEDERPAG